MEGEMSAKIESHDMQISTSEHSFPHQSTDLTVEIRQSDLTAEMQEFVLQISHGVFGNEELRSGSLRGMAGELKRAMDERFGGNWHCVLGRSFGSFVTHETPGFIFYYVGEYAVMLFKTA